MLNSCMWINQNIEAHSFIDLNLRKPLNDKTDVYLIMENLLDHEDIVARAPGGGARSQKPRTLKIGFTYKLNLVGEKILIELRY